MRLHALASACFLICSPFLAKTAFSASVDGLVVFGDSLSDNGNAAAALGGHFFYNGSSNYAVNAATDGPNTTPAIPAGGPTGLWIDQLSAKLNLADPKPIIQNVGGVLVPNAGGTNFAVAGALTGSNPTFNLATLLTNPSLPYTTDQLSIFNLFTGGHADPNSLYAFWGGSNDILQGQNPLAAANNISNNIKALAAEGAKYFLWVGEPDLGKIPLVAGTSLSAAATMASNAYNLQQAADLAMLAGLGITVVPVDVNSLFSGVPLNTTIPAQGLAGVNPDNYLFWDGLHPTTAGDSYIAALAAQDVINAGLAPGTATPEPGSFAAAGLGLASLALLARRWKRPGIKN